MSTPAATDPVPGRGTRRWQPTVRTRFLTAVLVLAALGLLVAGTTAYGLQRQRLDAFIDSSLTRNVAEFRALAEDGVDPSTGLPFDQARDLLRVGLARTVPAPNEGMLAMVDGVVTNVAPTSVHLRLEDDPELVAAAAAEQDSAEVVVRLLTTEVTQYRHVAVPVRVAGDDAAGVLLLAFDRDAEHAELARTYGTYGWVSLGSLILIGVVGWLLAGRLLAPLRVLQRTAQRISDTDLSVRIPVTGNDDISALTRTVNAMLDRLDRAFASQRRLLDDAGHELRTPLTIVRGHLELVDPDDPDDVTATRTLVLDELDRMQLLVDDLVTLATVDRPDFVRPEPVDVAELVDEIVDKARHLGAHRWEVASRADVRACLDPRRVTQAMLQLAANATKFAPEGSTVTVAAAVDGDRLLLSVRDRGPGVAPEDAERIFERFGRGSAGRGVEGSGLGLPIVAAIAAAHGGSVQVGPTRGPGATFVLDLPLTGPPGRPADDAPAQVTGRRGRLPGRRVARDHTPTAELALSTVDPPSPEAEPHPPRSEPS